MASSEEGRERKGWRDFLIQAVRASLVSRAERESIWSAPRPLLGLCLFLFSFQSGWLFWRASRDTLAKYPAGGWEFVAFETLSQVSSHGLGIAMSSLIVAEGVSTLMVMYNLGMNFIVRPIIKWHEDRGREMGREEGREEGKADSNREWADWYDRLLEHQARGEPFDEPRPDKRES